MKPVTKRLTVSTKQQNLRQLRRPIRSTLGGRVRPRRANDLILSPSDDLTGAKGRRGAQIGAEDGIERDDLSTAMKVALRKLLHHNGRAEQSLRVQTVYPATGSRSKKWERGNRKKREA